MPNKNQIREFLDPPPTAKFEDRAENGISGQIFWYNSKNCHFNLPFLDKLSTLVIEASRQMNTYEGSGVQMVNWALKIEKSAVFGTP